MNMVLWKEKSTQLMFESKQKITNSFFVLEMIVVHLIFWKDIGWSTWKTRTLLKTLE